MAKGAWSSGAASAEIIAASDYRDTIFIQNLSANTVALGIGEDAVAGQGIQLKRINDCVILKGHSAREAIYAIGASGAGSYQTNENITLFVPGPNPLPSS